MTGHGPDRHTHGSIGRYCVRLLGGSLELDFPDRTIEPPTAPAIIGPLIVLALRPRQAVGLEALKTLLHDQDASLVSTAQIQTPISRLRHLGLPIPPRQYLLDVAPSDVDIVDFDHRAKRFIDVGMHPSQLAEADLAPLVDEGHALHQLWQADPHLAVGSHPRLSALFESHRRRNRRFGKVFVRLLLRAAEPDRAGDVLYEYVDRYGADETFVDLETEVRTSSRTSEAVGFVLQIPGPTGEGPAITELRDRVAASAGLAFHQLAISAHNLDLIFPVDHLAIDHEARMAGPPVEAAGGAGSNAVFAAARLGHAVAVVGMVAGDRQGAILRASLGNERIDCANVLSVPSSPDAHTGICYITSDRAGRRIDVIAPGVNERFAQALRDDKAARQRLREAVSECRLLHLSSFTGDAERRLQVETLQEVGSETLVGFDPGALYAQLGLDRLTPFILRCDVLYLYEARLRQLIHNSSAATGGAYSFRGAIDALFRWRGSRTSRPLLLVVKRERPQMTDELNERYDMITLAVGRETVQDLVSTHVWALSEPYVTDITGQGDAIAAGVGMGMLHRAPLDQCADIAFVLANEANSEIGSRAGLPRRSTVAQAWAKYFPHMDLPAWVPRD